MKGYYPLFSLSRIFSLPRISLSPTTSPVTDSFSFTDTLPFSVSFSPPLVLPLPSPSPLCYCQAVKWMLANFRALLSNTLSCAGQVRGSAECNLAADETSTLKQLVRPPTVDQGTERRLCSRVKWRVLFISKGQHPRCQRISDLLMWCVYTAGAGKQKECKRTDVKRAGLGQCHLSLTCTRAQQRQKLSSVKRSWFWQPPSLSHTHTHTHAHTQRTGTRKEVGHRCVLLKAAEYDNLRGADRPCCQRRWPSSHSLCSEQERKQRRQKWQQGPKNSLSCWDTWE